MNENLVTIHEIRALTDSYFKKGLFTRVNQIYFNSARVVFSLAMAFNKTIDEKDTKYDIFFEDYHLFEKQIATIFKKLRHDYKNRKIVVETVDNKNNSYIYPMDPDDFVNRSIENLQIYLEARHIPFNKKYFK